MVASVEPTPKGHSQKQRISVLYPSGNLLKIFGRFLGHGKACNSPDSPYIVAIEILEAITVAGAMLHVGGAITVDPRCVISGEKTGLIYWPRSHCHEFPMELREWMAGNPDWPGPVLVADDNSGTIPFGTN